MSVSIVVPCYNEEANIEACITEVSECLRGIVDDYEFIIVNDCSRDRTGEIADRLAKQFPTVRVHHNDINRGLGYNYRKGVELAVKEYVMFIPGDNELKPASVGIIVKQAGKADLIVPYPENAKIRPWLRQALSWGFTTIVNWISGRKLRYYNGAALLRRKYLQEVSFDTNGFAFQAEILVQLLNAGYSSYEIPFQLNYSSTRLTVFRYKNVASVIHTLLRMTFTHRLRRRRLDPAS